MNFRLIVLALGTFAIGTGSFVFAGLLEGVAEELSVSVASAGHLVTVFAVTYAVCAPVLAAITGTVPRRRLLVFAMALFVAANFASVFAPTFSLLLASRVVAALGAAMFTPNAAAVASSLAEPEHRGRALAVVTGGLTIAFVIGIPLGSLIGTYYGWRATFVMVGLMAAVALVGVRILLPHMESPPAVGLRERVDALRQAPVATALSLTALGMMGGFVVFTYVGPLLAGITGFGGGGVSALLLLFGVAAMFGNSLGGYGADNLPYRRMAFGIMAVQAVSLASFSLLVMASGSPLALAGVCLSLVAWGVAGFALNPLQQYRVTQLAPSTQNVALSLNSSAIYLGQGVGAGLGSLTLGFGSLAALGVAGAACTSAALVILALGTRPEKPPEVAPEG
ncbi:MAG: MFS transporter [Rubrobacter sp.]|jgi:predicted MFS family arabinose efflux permease|nr:MFS transporter [Rubrobacter sp.]